jgi:mono/diheme cytochrome c family protein
VPVKHPILPFYLVTLAIIVAAGCKRHSREYADRPNAPMGSPVYTIAAKESMAAGEERITEVFPASAGAVDGAALYAKSCGACHQATGLGVPGAFPPLDGSPYVTGDNVERLASIMLYGMQGPINVKGTVYNGIMTPQGGLFNDAELAAVATYVRGSWSNKAAAVDKTVFASMRQKWGTRGPFQISELGEEQ